MGAGDGPIPLWVHTLAHGRPKGASKSWPSALASQPPAWPVPYSRRPPPALRPRPGPRRQHPASHLYKEGIASPLTHLPTGIYRISGTPMLQVVGHPCLSIPGPPSSSARLNIVPFPNIHLPAQCSTWNNSRIFPTREFPVTTIRGQPRAMG